MPPVPCLAWKLHPEWRPLRPADEPADQALVAPDSREPIPGPRSHAAGREKARGADGLRGLPGDHSPATQLLLGVSTTPSWHLGPWSPGTTVPSDAALGERTLSLNGGCKHGWKVK